jgi:hypothetical protein
VKTNVRFRYHTSNCHLIANYVKRQAARIARFDFAISKKDGRVGRGALCAVGLGGKKTSGHRGSVFS